jgi:protein O-mannosyl-transferase
MRTRGKVSRDTGREQPSALTSSPKPRLPSIWVIVLALSLVSLVFAAYGRSLGFQFILDDHRYTSDPRIQESGHLWDYFTNYVWAQYVGGPPSFYRPTFAIWLRLNFMLAALSPWGWHLLSIAKHVVVGALLGLLIWELLRDWAAALAGASLFALHPAQTESVSWVSVPDPLMSAGLLAALLLYLRYAGYRSSPKPPEKKSHKKSSHAAGPSPLWMIASALAYLAALLAKETAVIFPFLIFAIALFMNSATPARSSSKETGFDFSFRVRKALGHTAPFVCVTVLYLLLRLNALGGKIDVSTQHLGLRTLLLSWPATLWFYFKVMLWPVKSYSFADPTLVQQFSARSVLLPLFGLACCGLILTAASVYAWRKAQRESAAHEGAGIKIAVITGILLLVLPLLLTLNLNGLNPGDFLHGRYTYLPLAGLMLLVATGWHLAKNFRVVLICSVGLLTALFTRLTFAQEVQWNDDATVFRTAHQLAPHNAPVARNLADSFVRAALQLQDEGRCNEAIPVFDRVIQDYPDDWYAWAGRGVCYVQLKDLVKAEESLHRAGDISHNSQVIQQWQELRAQMGLPNSGSTSNNNY